MRVTSLLKESSLTAIAERLYANLTDGSRKLAESALLNANPNLAKPDGFRPGAIIHVPDVPSLKRNPSDFAQEDPVSNTRKMLVQALEEFQAKSKEVFSSNLTELKGQIDFLAQNDLTKANKTQAVPLKPKDLISVFKERIKENELGHNRLTAALELAKNDLVK